MLVQNSYSNSPLVLSIPHSGILIPNELTGICHPHAKRLHTDWNLRELTAHSPHTTIAATISRYIVDLNRERDRVEKATQPIIPRTDEDGHALFYHYPSKKKQEEWIRLYYNPYYESLMQILNQKLQEHTTVYLCDLHSYDDSLFETNAVIIGTRRQRSCTTETCRKLMSLFESEGISVTFDSPFSGGNLIKTFGKLPGVEAFQLEIPYSMYLNGHSLSPTTAPNLEKKLISILDSLTI